MKFILSALCAGVRLVCERSFFASVLLFSLRQYIRRCVFTVILQFSPFDNTLALLFSFAPVRKLNLDYQVTNQACDRLTRPIDGGEPQLATLTVGPPTVRAKKKEEKNKKT